MIVGGLLITGVFIVYLASTSGRYVQKRSLRYYKLKWNSMIL